MTEEVTLSVLDQSHNSRLLELNESCPIEAGFSFFYDRSPDFFAWAREAFEEHVYLGIFLNETLVGYSLLGFTKARLKGVPFRHGILGDSRLLPEARGRGFMRQAYRMLTESLPSDVHLGAGVVLRGNAPMTRLLEKADPGGFSITAVFPFDLLTIPLIRKVPRSRGISIREPTWDDLPRVLELLDGHAEHRFLTPYVDEDTLRGIWDADLHGGRGHWLVAERGGRVDGVMALVDEHDLKRMVILNYGSKSIPLRLLHRAARTFLRGMSPLPRPGETLRKIYCRWFAVEGDDPVVVRDLVAAGVNRHLGRGIHALHIGLGVPDPMRQGVRGFLANVSRCDLYVGEAGEGRLDFSGSEIPSIDLSTF